MLALGPGDSRNPALRPAENPTEPYAESRGIGGPAMSKPEGRTAFLSECPVRYRLAGNGPSRWGKRDSPLIGPVRSRRSAARSMIRSSKVIIPMK